MEQDNYKLSWPDYSDYLQDTLRKMMNSESYKDVTLVCDDMRQIQAHRNILSTCSPIFNNILKIDSQNRNAVVFFRGVNHQDMESIVTFIYKGETSVSQERLNDFFSLAKSLEINELSTEEYEERIEHGEIIPQAPASPVKRKRKSTAKYEKYVDGEGEERMYNCNECNYKTKHPSHVKRHVEAIHDGVKKFTCRLCDYRATQSTHLKHHMTSKHYKVSVDNQFSVDEYKQEETDAYKCRFDYKENKFIKLNNYKEITVDNELLSKLKKC